MKVKTKVRGGPRTNPNCVPPNPPGGPVHQIP
jgi:hypothetical protein